MCSLNNYDILENVTCFKNDCYFVAFGVPTLLMMVALTLFISGRNMYRKVPPEGNALVYVCAAVWVSCFIYVRSFFYRR